MEMRVHRAKSDCEVLSIVIIPEASSKSKCEVILRKCVAMRNKYPDIIL